ncbi:MAG: coenzyme F420-0:L-glutamate ligase [Chloroflexi bacterium]|nr:coenzyme F420-0:L-glutamate ligase [Chloroflexota bacterium]
MSGTWAIVPLRGLEDAKTRLGAELDPEERLELVTTMARRTLAATRDARGLDGTVLVTADPEAAALAAEYGATTLVQRLPGLNAALREARAVAIGKGAGSILIVPIDLHAISAEAVDALLDEAVGASPGSSPVVVGVRDRDGGGTNALFVRPPAAIEPAFGEDSFAAHRDAAAASGIRFVQRDGPLTLDVDTGADLLATERHEPAAAVQVVALLGIPEIVPGDDLAARILAALESAPGLLPLRPDDVLVVTQKVVSKAEGAIVELDGIEPRPEAVEFAERWDRDPRQLEVVLREARRVVRMERGVLITETPHGFICANGGIDASNVGPASGSIVTLLPADPDASAARIRAAIRDRHGLDVPVVISDSFGRPWRWGIVDVAIGVSGLQPIEDLRGEPDRDGRIMKSTVRAVADELASAAELVLGKSAGRPAALIRGASFRRGEGSIRDALMPAAWDLFR